MGKTVRTTSVGPVRDLPSALALLRRRAEAAPFEGFRFEDHNLPDHLLVVDTPNHSYSFRHEDVIEEETLSGGRTRLWVRRGSEAWQSNLFAVGGAPPDQPFLVAMEEMPPPPPRHVEGMPTAATGQDRDLMLRTTPAAATIAAAAAAYDDACAGRDRYANNCAHFLSDAFIRAGFTELQRPNDCIEARCGTSAKRPIRARNMWCWFQSKATQTTTRIERNSGIWAVFQLKESEYWGGHVVIIDSNTWVWYGTGCYWDWNQYCHKW